MALRVLVVDDEPLARKRLRRLLQEHAEIEIVGEAGDGQSARRLIERLHPDLVFLDIQMPGLSGFDVLRRLKHRPRIIFVTAHDEYALEAFEEQALDYLLKPVEPDRLARALARVRSLADDRIDRLLNSLERSRGAAAKIPVRQGTRITLVEPASIAFVRAEDKYSVLYTADREHVLDRPLEELARSLDPAAFVRVHRSVIVNIHFVRDLTTVEGGRYLVSLSDSRATRVHASRSGARLLRQRLKI